MFVKPSFVIEPTSFLEKNIPLAVSLYMPLETSFQRLRSFVSELNLVSRSKVYPFIIDLTYSFDLIGDMLLMSTGVQQNTVKHFNINSYQVLLQSLVFVRIYGKSHPELTYQVNTLLEGQTVPTCFVKIVNLLPLNGSVYNYIGFSYSFNFSGKFLESFIESYKQGDVTRAIFAVSRLYSNNKYSKNVTVLTVSTLLAKSEVFVVKYVFHKDSDNLKLFRFDDLCLVDMSLCFVGIFNISVISNEDIEDVKIALGLKGYFVMESSLFLFYSEMWSYVIESSKDPIKDTAVENRSKGGKKVKTGAKKANNKSSGKVDLQNPVDNIDKEPKGSDIGDKKDKEVNKT